MDGSGLLKPGSIRIRIRNSVLKVLRLMTKKGSHWLPRLQSCRKCSDMIGPWQAYSAASMLCDNEYFDHPKLISYAVDTTAAGRRPSTPFRHIWTYEKMSYFLSLGLASFDVFYSIPDFGTTSQFDLF